MRSPRTLARTGMAVGVHGSGNREDALKVAGENAAVAGRAIMAPAGIAGVALHPAEATGWAGLFSGRGTAAKFDWPIHAGTARRTCDGPSIDTEPSPSARDHGMSPRQIGVSVRRLTEIVEVTS